MGDPGAKGLPQSTDVRHTGDSGSVHHVTSSVLAVSMVRC